MPRAEVDAKASLFTAHGFSAERIFTGRDDAYLDFRSGLAKAELKDLVTDDEGVQDREAQLRAALDRWWEHHATLVAELPVTKTLMTVRRTLMEGFTVELLPVGLLDRFQLSGVIVRWWNNNQYDLRTLVAHGFTGVVDGWVTTITAIEDTDAKTNPLDHKLVPVLLPSYLEELAAVEAQRAAVDAQIKAGAATYDEDEEDEEGTGNMEVLSPAELAALKKQLTGVKKQQKAMQQELITKLGKARAELTAAQECDLVLRLTKNDLSAHLDGYVTVHRQQIIVALENWWDKYAVPLRKIEAERVAATAKLTAFLKDLGYE